MTTLMHWFDLAAVFVARVLALLALAFGFLWVAVWILYAMIRRAGFGGALIDFLMLEIRRSPRKVWGRMCWGAKDDAG